MSTNPKDLVGYCGLYCGACGIYQQRVTRAVENLRKVISAYGFDKITTDLAKWEPAFQHYPEFENVMTGLVKLFGSCPGCIQGGGNPECILRACSKQKTYATCAECNEMETCEKLQRYPWAKGELRKIKKIGVDKWANEMQEKVAAGYCSLDERLK